DECRECHDETETLDFVDHGTSANGLRVSCGVPKVRQGWGTPIVVELISRKCQRMRSWPRRPNRFVTIGHRGRRTAYSCQIRPYRELVSEIGRESKLEAGRANRRVADQVAIPLVAVV